MSKKILMKYESNKTQMRGGEKMMKAIFRLCLVAMLGAVFAGPASAAILDSKHDFSSDSANTTYAVAGEDRMCVFCHTPHNAELSVPLWNRSGGGSTFLLYTTSSTLTSAVKVSAITTDNISYKCLSCHDGTVAIGSGVINGNIGGAGDKISGATGVGRGTKSLTDDHPIGFDFSRVSANGDTYIQDFTYATAAGMKFYKAGSLVNQMECASCHDVHGQAAEGTKFLRTSNNGSKLCLSCHIK